MTIDNFVGLKGKQVLVYIGTQHVVENINGNHDPPQKQ